MIAKDLISNLIPPLTVSDTGDKALLWMQEFGVQHLAVTENDKYLGLLSEDDIFDFKDPSDKIGSNATNLFKPLVHDKLHIFEIIKIAVELKLSLIPIVDEEENFLGVITQEGIISSFANLSSIHEKGGIIVLELNKNDYSLSEIARIVESNNTNILSSYVSVHKDSTKTEVTLKIGASDVRQIIATFERFKYTVLGSYQETHYYEDLKDRYNSLMSYLNV